MCAKLLNESDFDAKCFVFFESDVPIVAFTVSAKKCYARIIEYAKKSIMTMY